MPGTMRTRLSSRQHERCASQNNNTINAARHYSTLHRLSLSITIAEPASLLEVASRNIAKNATTLRVFAHSPPGALLARKDAAGQQMRRAIIFSRKPRVRAAFHGKCLLQPLYILFRDEYRHACALYIGSLYISLPIASDITTFYDAMAF